MLQNKILSLPLVLFFAVAVFFTACDNSGTGSDGSMGTMTVEMTDAPIDSADAVNVFIERVEVNNAENDEEGWTVLNEPQKIYNLLELTNGATEVIATKKLEPGTYNQIRLILSRGGHSVEVDGESYDMKVPSGSETGVKLNVDVEIEPDYEYVLLIDFDASRSVVAAGPPGNAVKYLLKPVPGKGIIATEKAITGNIEGEVEPAEARPVIFAIDDVDATEPDTLASTIADTTSGYFKIIGLEEGSYDVAIDPRTDGYQADTLKDVNVTIGQSNEVGTVELNQQ